MIAAVIRRIRQDVSSLPARVSLDAMRDPTRNPTDAAMPSHPHRQAWRAPTIPPSSGAPIRIDHDTSGLSPSRCDHQSIITTALRVGLWFVRLEADRVVKEPGGPAAGAGDFCLHVGF
jgi:hypothetical protein